MSEELKACPACDYTNCFQLKDEARKFYCHCPRCGMVGPFTRTKKEAITAWNSLPRRSDIERVERERDWLAQRLDFEHCCAPSDLKEEPGYCLEHECKECGLSSMNAWLEAAKGGHMSEVKFKPFQRVLVRDSNQDRWLPDIFRIFDDCNTHPYYCMHNNYRQCIPYNDETKHLLGTTNSPTPPEPEFRWGDKVAVRDKEDEMWHLGIFMDKHDDRFYAIVNKTAGSMPWKFCRHANW